MALDISSAPIFRALDDALWLIDAFLPPAREVNIGQ
jgi:hypothetical protein